MKKTLKKSKQKKVVRKVAKVKPKAKKTSLRAKPKKAIKKKVAVKKATKKKAVKKKVVAKRAASKKKTIKKVTKKAASKKPSAKKKVAKKVVAKKAKPKKKVVKKVLKKKLVKKVVAKKAKPKKKVVKKVIKKKPVKKVVAKKKLVKKVIVKRKEVKEVLPRKVVARKLPKLTRVTGPTDVKPYQSKKDEDYMSEEQLGHFRRVLLKWKAQLMEEVDRTMHHMQDDVSNYPDPVDRASQEEEFSLELRTRDRERKLLRKIEGTINRINEHDYGYCDDCGAEVGVKRLEARPTATQCIECKTISEIREKQIGDGR